MIKQIFVNLPVKELKRSMEFFSRIGFEFDPKFTDEKAACLIMGENIYAMLLSENFFKTFTKKQISDAKKDTEIIVSVSVDTRQDVDKMITRAISAGGTVPRPAQDLGFMYVQGFEDLDGHLWEVLFMSSASQK